MITIDQQAPIWAHLLVKQINAALIQDPDITGGQINGASIGSTTPSTGTFSTLTLSTAARIITTTAALTDNAGAATGTMTNAPSAGNPAKWVEVNDNGTASYVPLWT
jgi:hypothetical protein|tara:strand:- start:226 stop:546 length:321 start_codon:yes stop_codon:yes gene_type:complete